MAPPPVPALRVPEADPSLPCPVCGTPVASGLPDCPTCGFAGVM
ncbi:MAG TPA: hypothetical protein VGB42_06660 [Candidatus Thermoplasmatota archaeon]